uniref:Uncharacterized protein n=1 Tax=Amphimedon queenslandica TaxID=400682 RepID=A0A1X7T6C4_AMPQE
MDPGTNYYQPLYSCSAELPQNATVKFSTVRVNGSNTDGLSLQWHSTCNMNVFNVHVQCENIQPTHCMSNSESPASVVCCLETDTSSCPHCSRTPVPPCHTHSAFPTISPNLSSSFSASNTQFSQLNIPLTIESTATIDLSPTIVTTLVTHDSSSVVVSSFDDFPSSSSADLISPSPSLTVESTATIDLSPAIVTLTTQYSSTPMTHDSSSVVVSSFDDFPSSSSADLISPSPSPTSLYCLPDPPWPLTPAGCDAPLNSTCQYGLFNATRCCNESGNWDPVICLANKNLEAIVLLASSSPYDALDSLSNSINTISAVQTVVLLDIIVSSNARNATTTEEFGRLLLKTFDEFLNETDPSHYDEEVSIKIF